MKRAYPSTIIGKNGETLFELVKKSPPFLDFFLREIHGSYIYQEDIIEIQSIVPSIKLSEKAYKCQEIKEQIYKSGSLCLIKSLKISKKLPFVPDESQVIYVENLYEPPLNNFIEKNIDSLSFCLKEKDKTFIYIPQVVGNIRNNFSYYYPNQYDKVLNVDVTSSSISRQIFAYCVDYVKIQTGLIRYKGIVDDYYIFSYYVFDKLDDVDFLKYFEWYSLILEKSYPVSASPVPSSSERRRSKKSDPKNTADYEFDSHTEQLIDEIKERVEALKQKGINEMVLKAIFSPNVDMSLSKLVITKNYKIFLPDYNNMEINMYPLPKAVFFLFLNHPKGILFKNLPDYRDELIAVYKKISGRENIDDMVKSINDIVNPTSNSINEKCSRIREAFISKFDESIAQHYFITGDRATPKKITLDRSLVILDEVEIAVDVVKTPFEYVNYYKPYILPELNLDKDDLPF